VGWGDEADGAPHVLPGSAGAWGAVEDDEVAVGAVAAFGEEVAGGEACLSAADDGDVDLVDRLSHGGPLS